MNSLVFSLLDTFFNFDDPVWHLTDCQSMTYLVFLETLKVLRIMVLNLDFYTLRSGHNNFLTALRAS